MAEAHGLPCPLRVTGDRSIGEDAMAEMNKRVPVVIVDDLEVVRIGLRAGLENSERIAVVAEGSSEVDAVRLADEYRPYCFWV